MGPRCGRDVAEMGPRWGRDGAEMGPRWGRDGAEMGPLSPGRSSVQPDYDCWQSRLIAIHGDARLHCFAFDFFSIRTFSLCVSQLFRGAPNLIRKL